MTELVYQTSTSQVCIMRSRVRYADLSWNEGKTPILLFVIQILVSLSIGYFVQSFRSTNSIFSNVSHDPCNNSCKLFFFTEATN